MSEHEQIRDILIAHKGKKNGIKSQIIAEMIGIEPGPSNVNIRTKITETIKRYGLPIAGNPGVGYYFMANRKELDEYMKSLLSRIEEITDRKARIFYYYMKHHPEEDEGVELTGEIIDPEDFDE